MIKKRGYLESQIKSDKIETENCIKSPSEDKSFSEISLDKTDHKSIFLRTLPLKKYLGFIYWNIFLRGVFMGLFDLIPGISGGTIALATGIYDKLLHNINQINFKFIKALCRLDLRYIYGALNWKFLISLFFGIGFSLLTFCRIISFCLSKPSLNFLIYSVIFGLILGSIIYLLRRIKKWNIYLFICLFLGVMASYFITCFFGFNSFHDFEMSSNASPLFFDPLLIISGSIAISMALLPGVSGSFVLLLFGEYYKVIRAVASITSGFSFTSFFVFFNLFIGIFLGAFFFSKTITFLLDKYTFYTLSFLSGLMIGSVQVIWPYKNCSVNYNFFSFSFCLSFIFISVAILFVLFLQKNDIAKKKTQT